MLIASILDRRKQSSFGPTIKHPDPTSEALARCRCQRRIKRPIDYHDTQR